jgi:hypothetical protein
MAEFMKFSEVTFKDFGYLPKELMLPFSEAYIKAFPELKLPPGLLISYLNRKFKPINSGKSLNIAVISTNEGQVVSGYGIVRNKYQAHGEEIGVGLVCDVFTDLEFRRMGLFKRVSLLAIEREALTDTSFLIGFPIRDEVMPGHVSVGWKHVFNMPLWWALPLLGSLTNTVKNPTLEPAMFDVGREKIAIIPSLEFLRWRFSLHSIDYFLVKVSDSTDFAIVRKSKVKNLPFTCIVFMQTTSNENSRELISQVRKLSFQLKTLGVLGCWNESYAKELFVNNSGLKKSKRYQKVIIRQLKDLDYLNDESKYQLSWLDSDTL